MEKEYKYKATGLIAKAFDEHKFKYKLDTFLKMEEIQASFGIDCGPNTTVSFISTDNDNDVAVRVFHLVSNIPEEKRIRAIEACNTLNEKVRALKFVMDSENNIDVEYDFSEISDDYIGEAAVKMFVRVMTVLDHEYPIFVKALFSDEDLTKENRIERAELFMKLLESIDEKKLKDGIEDNENNDFDEDDIIYD